ncbi:sensor histidine kinase [Pseudaquabacterium rugosum]|uniref:histidine kinase n=1 Tax=Pseudaquabacterium rugosum TaxID=2984194 RepID=A0ABU9B8Y1_9BURK
MTPSPPTPAPAASTLGPPPPIPAPRRRLGRPLLWGALIALLMIAQSLLVVLTVRHEDARAQERTDDAAQLAQAEIRRRVQQLLQGLLELQTLQDNGNDTTHWGRDATALMRRHPEVGRIEWRDENLHLRRAQDWALWPGLYARWPREQMQTETGLACNTAQHGLLPSFSRSQFVPLADGRGAEVVDVCVPTQRYGRLVGYTVATVLLSGLLDELSNSTLGRSHEMSFVEPDGTRLARAGSVRGAGVYVTDRLVSLPGLTLQLRLDAAERRPSLIPNLATALVLGLSLALAGVVALLARDGRRRARAEAALAESLAFRKAMEDSLLTGLRARDRDGRIVYVNPAFCAMTGWDAAELMAASQPPYWPPDQAPIYLQRQTERLALGAAGAPSREGYETEFVRKNGERFPVMVYEAPLVDGQGRHTGWMGAVLDLSAQRRVEDLSRQQQEKLQASARLASVGEMASLLSHELNQPLAAIASYATGSLNLMGPAPAPGEPPAAWDPELPGLLRHALERIAEQAERAGRVIKSVHDFVRRRHQAHEIIGADVLVESVLPLVRLQARKCGARITLDIAQPAPRIRVDRTMLEQVLLNLARNGLQAMEADTPLAARELTLRVLRGPGPWAAFEVEDAGHGIPAEVAAQLFTPFFTTKIEGMGLGLSLCRTVIEQHGGALDFRTRDAAGGAPPAEPGALPVPATGESSVAPAADPLAGTSAPTPAAPHGTVFRFTLPLVETPRRAASVRPPEPGHD